MKMKNRLLELREIKKSRKPAFVAQDSWRRKEVVQDSWRMPRGKHSKIRLRHSGNPKMPSQGYRSPKAVRGFHKSGLKPVVISSPKQLESVKDEGIIISSSLGMKKRLEILKAAAERKLAVLNINAQDFIKKAEEKLADRKKKQTEAPKPEKAAKKPDEQKEAEAAKKEEEEKEKSEEEKRKVALKEMERIITKRD